MIHILVDHNNETVTQYTEREYIIQYLQTLLDDGCDVESYTVIRINVPLGEVKTFAIDREFTDDDYEYVSLREYVHPVRGYDNLMVDAPTNEAIAPVNFADDIETVGYADATDNHTFTGFNPRLQTPEMETAIEENTNDLEEF